MMIDQIGLHSSISTIVIKIFHDMLIECLSHGEVNLRINGLVQSIKMVPEQMRKRQVEDEELI